MTRFFDRGEEPDKEYFYENDEVTVQLNETTFIGNLHETMMPDMTIAESYDSVYDRVAVQDPTDNLYWSFWRIDVGDEKFTELEYVLRRCGSFLVRQTALQSTIDVFNSNHGLGLNDDDLAKFLEAS